MASLNSFFDKIYVVNLDSRRDRWEYMKQQFRELGITNYERFSAVKPTLETVSLQPNWQATYDHLKVHGLMGRDTSDRYVLGCLGCKLSHYFILKLAQVRGQKKILILEDDFEFVEDVVEKFQEAIQLQPNFNMLYFAGSHARPPLQIGKEGQLCSIRRLQWSFTTAAYAVTDTFIPTLLAALDKGVEEIDVTYARLHPTHWIECVIPHLGRQRPSYSDIRGSIQDYSGLGT